ncbi:unnamed protein product [marine sediment metagenome]|uniref:DUF2493 domain-containing protein n=1 Tax=marine sediment metagenome TaxID=412755 RepID=X0XVZ4_9ZZZZ
MRIGIVGTRERNTEQDFQIVSQAFSTVVEDYAGRKGANSGHPLDDIELVSGGCPTGADRFAERIAREWQLPITIFYAGWARHGKGAGFLRNEQIVKRANVLIACVAVGRKGGTEDTIRRFQRIHPGGKLSLV